MHCKVCGEGDTQLLWTPEQTEVVHGQKSGPWYHCLCCGSDSCPQTYADFKDLYSYAYLHDPQTRLGQEGVREQIRCNVQWFEDYRHYDNGAGRGVPVQKDFLDIGYSDGTFLKAMEEKGWSIHGFDVQPAVYQGAHTTIAPRFHAGLFPQQYAAVNCRECIEHVEDWRSLLTEIHHVTHLGGLFQLQTPRPWHTPHPIPYQVGHLQIFAPFTIRYWLEHLGFAVLDWRNYEAGFYLMAQKVDG